MAPYDHSAADLRRHDVHDTIRDWSYQAAHKVAADEHYARLIAEAAQSRQFAADGEAGSGWEQLIDVTRQRLGEALAAVGMRLQGLHPAAGTAASPALER
jgi:hypothetical protein